MTAYVTIFKTSKLSVNKYTEHLHSESLNVHARNLEKSTSVYAYLYRTVNIAMFDPNNKYSYVQ